MTARPRALAAAGVAALLVASAPVRAEDAAATIADGREYLVPELADDPFAIDDGPRRFLHRFSFSPAYGRLGGDRLYAMRFAYNASSWLAWEASIAHNPAESVHALVHGVNGIVRRPLPGRFQPYVTAGYGMILVFPGESLNADPVTENVLAAGGGLEIYVRNDVALRLEGRGLAVIGGQRGDDGTVAYGYRELTAGLAFYRGLAE